MFDVFEGGALADEGKKSLAIEVTLQPTAETLTDKDIEAVVAEGGGGRQDGDGRRDPLLEPRRLSGFSAIACFVFAGAYSARAADEG